MTPHERICAVVARHHLGYYFNPGGVEFFDDAHPSIPHCQLSEYSEEEDADRIERWEKTHFAALTQPKTGSYIYHTEGQWPIRVINGRYFHRCTLSCEIEEEGRVKQWTQGFRDIEETPDRKGWVLFCDDSDKVMTLQPQTPEAYSYWENRLFSDHP